MGYGARRCLIGLGTAAVAGAVVLGQAGTAGATGGGLGRLATRTTSQVRAAVPGSSYGATTRTLKFGTRGPAVKALQERLSFLHYYLGKPDGRFGWNTMEAVWAFKEVQSGKRIPRNPDIVGPAMQRELRHPKLPKARRPHGGASRIEVNKSNEVLVVYRHGKQVLISHVSTADSTRPDGNGWLTPNGRYRAWRFDPGCVPDATFGGCLYNPVFFIGTTYAIHGMPNPTSTFSYDGVPLNPASHGCVRIPLDVSAHLHKLIHVSPTNGTPVFILGPALLSWP